MLKDDILKQIDTTAARVKIADALGVSENTVRRYIKNNSDDLTKAKALEVIKKITNKEEVLA